MVGKSVYTANGAEVILTCQKFTERMYSGTYAKHIIRQDQLVSICCRVTACLFDDIIHILISIYYIFDDGVDKIIHLVCSL